MDRTDLSLLGCLSEHWSPARFFGHKDASQIFNRPVDLPRADQVVERLGGLIATGYLVAKSGNKGVFIPEEHELRDAVQAAGKRPPSREELFLGLTALGGKRWEESEAPDWSAFVLCELIGRKELRIQAASREVLKDLFKDIRSKVGRPKILQPWQPVYWKFFPQGVGVSFGARRVPIALQRAVAEKRRTWMRSQRLIK